MCIHVSQFPTVSFPVQIRSIPLSRLLQLPPNPYELFPSNPFSILQQECSLKKVTCKSGHNDSHYWLPVGFSTKVFNMILDLPPGFHLPSVSQNFLPQYPVSLLQEPLRYLCSILPCFLCLEPMSITS